MAFVEFFGDDLSDSTLHRYLKDPTFVEYFNSFLLLPAFTRHVFYNSDTGYFEQVCGDGVRVGWGEGGVTPSTSLATLYLSDDTLGPSLDLQQCWLWVLQHRLPLFLHSDLYSEYKLCKILTTSKPETARPLSKADMKQEFPRSSVKRQRIEVQRDDSSDMNSSPTLPSIVSSSPPTQRKPLRSEHNLTNTSSLARVCSQEMLINRSKSQIYISSNPPTVAASGINASKSDIQLANASRNLSPQYDVTKRHGSISLVDVPLAHLRPVNSTDSAADSKLHLEAAALSAEDLQLLASKSAMGTLWRFLRGKAGERNWLFWLDAERVKYCSKPIDQKRLLRELRERYLHAGCQLELPADARRKLRGPRCARQTLPLLTALQSSLAQALRDYWCPRFILHHKHEAGLTTLTPSHRHSLCRSYSTTPMTLQDHTHQQAQNPAHYSNPDNEITRNYPKNPSPFVPTQTPTFRKLPTNRSKPATRNSKASRQKHTVIQEPEETAFASDTGHDCNQNFSNKSCFTPHRPHTVPGSVGRAAGGGGGGGGEGVNSRTGGGRLTAEEEGAMRASSEAVSSSSRKVWNRQGWECSTSSSSNRVDSRRSESRNRAKYTLHHLPDPTSRCASAIDSPGKQAMCNSRCQILSVAGTPLHPVTPLPSHPHTPTITTAGLLLECGSVLYAPLLRCLGTEQRKAGGYFQQHLENMDSKVSLNCLLFWRELQAYKALFIVPAFSPCAVEMKAKALYARFISAEGAESVGCPRGVVGEVCSSLWPPYEDLFDQPEEHALATLLTEWVELSTSEERLFQKLEAAPPSRHSSARAGSRRGLTSDLVGLEDLDEEDVFLDCDNEQAAAAAREEEEGEGEGEEDGLAAIRSRSVSRQKLCSGRSRPSSSLRVGVVTTPTQPGVGPLQSSTPQLQEQPQAISLNNIIDSPTELEYFKVYLNENYAAQELMCWMEIEAFRGIPISDKHVRNVKAKQLRSRYFTKKYFFGPSSPASKEAQRQVVQAGGGAYGAKLPARPRTPVFREAQKHIRGRLEKKWVANFITTPEFLERNGASEAFGRQISKVANKSQDRHPTYEKTFANSHGAIVFRRALQDGPTRELFVRYLQAGTHSSTKFPQQDVHFWLEVQRYKELYHAHTTADMLQSKLRAIVDCYLHSPSPPRLQLDVPVAVAEQCTKKERGPYVFREAQAAVFKHLYYCWQDYENFTTGCSGQGVEAAIEKLVSQIQASELAAFSRSKDDPEVDLKKLSVPRFETVVEREERLRKEKELSEFGKVAVAFRLSTPNPRYKYYTDLPEDFIEAEDLEDTATDLSTVEQATSAAQKADRSSQRAQQQQPRSSKPADSKRHSTIEETDSPVVVMKMQRNRKPSNAPIPKETSSTDFQQQIREELPVRPDVSHQELLLHKQSPRNAHYYGDRKTAKPNSARSRKQPPPASKGRKTPEAKTAISMKRSREKRNEYGSSLSQEGLSVVDPS